MGVASDGLPLTYLHDPVLVPFSLPEIRHRQNSTPPYDRDGPGMMHQPQELQFGVLTSHPDEWSALRIFQIM